MQNKAKVLITAIIVTVAITFTLILVVLTTKEAEILVNIETNQLEISGGIYNKTIDIDENVEISIVEPIEITKKRNGAAFGDTKSGYFQLVGDIDVYLNLGDSTQDWIAIIDGEDRYYINLKDENDTLDLYQQLLSLQE